MNQPSQSQLIFDCWLMCQFSSCISLLVGGYVLPRSLIGWLASISQLASIVWLTGDSHSIVWLMSMIWLTSNSCSIVGLTSDYRSLGIFQSGVIQLGSCDCVITQQYWFTIGSEVLTWLLNTYCQKYHVWIQTKQNIWIMRLEWMWLKWQPLVL